MNPESNSAGEPDSASPRRSLSRGARLGAFEILGSLGSGGMGEVYRAKDTKLGREVAVKVLPAEVSSDPERVKRFEKEARSASALNHPNIVTIHDSGTSEGVSWIAMELVEGQTLRQLVSSGPVSVKRLLPVATQIAEGLAKAHEVGIVHRDLKPENVMVTRDGRVKILDFGLAKLTGPISGSDEHSQLPTITGTSPGVILGTVGYMSPEQAAGTTVDYRSDQFSFGSILYEMATGRRAFQKKTAVDTLSAILNQEPEALSAANPQAPAPLRWIVGRCLEKEPENRYVATRDLARELASVQSHLSDTTSGAAGPDRAPKKRRLRALAVSTLGGLLLIASGIAAHRWWVSRNASAPIPTFRQLTFRRGNLRMARFAADGKTVVYAAAWDGAKPQIYTVRTDTPVSSPLGLEGSVFSVSSKDELAISIVRDGKPTLARVSLGGGTPRELLEDVVAADWAPNGDDLAVVRRDGGRYRLEYPIGTLLYDSANLISFVRVAPTGNLVGFFERGKLMTIDRQKRMRVLSEGRGWGPYFAWSPQGYKILVSGSRSADENAVYAIALTGSLQVVLPNAHGLALQDVASDGRLLLEDWRERDGIAVRRKDDKRERELGWTHYTGVRFISDDGSFVVCDQTQDAGDPGAIYLRKTDGSPAVRLGTGGSIQDLSRDGRWVLSLLPGPPRQLVATPTGPGAARKIPVDGFEPLGAAFLGNGKGFFVVGQDESRRPIVGVVGPDGGTPRMLPAEGFTLDKDGFVAPDGDRFCYVTGDLKIRIGSISGGEATTVPGDPLGAAEHLVGWNADGRHLYVSNGKTRIDRLDIATGRRELWRDLTPDDPTGIVAVGPFAIAPDGRSYAYSYVRSFVDDLFVVGLGSEARR